MKQKANHNDILIGKAVRRIRRTHDKYQSDIARLWKVTTSMVHYYEKGAVKIPLEKLQQFADHFGISISALLPPVTKKSRLGK